MTLAAHVCRSRHLAQKMTDSMNSMVICVHVYADVSDVLNRRLGTYILIASQASCTVRHPCEISAGIMYL